MSCLPPPRWNEASFDLHACPERLRGSRGGWRDERAGAGSCRWLGVRLFVAVDVVSVACCSGSGLSFVFVVANEILFVTSVRLVVTVAAEVDHVSAICAVEISVEIVCVLVACHGFRSSISSFLASRDDGGAKESEGMKVQMQRLVNSAGPSSGHVPMIIDLTALNREKNACRCSRPDCGSAKCEAESLVGRLGGRRCLLARFVLPTLGLSQAKRWAGFLSNLVRNAASSSADPGSNLASSLSIDHSIHSHQRHIFSSSSRLGPAQETLARRRPLSLTEMTVQISPTRELVVDLVVGEREAVSDQTVAVSASLWNLLQQSTSGASSASSSKDASSSSKIAVSLRPSSGRRLRLSNIPSLVVYAVKSTRDTAGLWIEASKSTASALGSSSRAHRSDSGRRVCVQAHTLVDASLVYLQATSLTSYDAANSNQAELVRQLDAKILRQGQVIRPQLGATVAPLRVVMLEPLLQGVFSAESSDVLLTLQADADVDQFDSSMISSVSEDSYSIASGSDAGHEDADSADELQDEDDLEIDERFLAQTVLEDFSNLDISIDPAANGNAAVAPLHRTRDISRVKPCTLQQLQDPSTLTAAISHWFTQVSTTSESSALTGEAHDNIDEENVVLATEREMASLGAFNGDWLAASADGDARSRLVRILSSQDLPATEDGTRSVWVSPVLAQNILGDQVFATSPRSVVIRVLGSRPSTQQQDVSALVRSCPVPVPFAESLRIARVAGPLSVDRAYQGLFLDALRTFFEDRRRICRNGDIIAVAIEASKARFVSREAEQEGNADSAPDDIHELKFPSVRVPPRRRRSTSK